ncbi:ATP-dependent RNA helicase a-like protein [Plakobranchus ocellatus]|uniref:ATP-dependent RNA helicase a-like protein n=1 Tax=Plakobranchus ocellatus TaxID=259542 RepID=A0AAV4ADQ3_9GAST|nr:ATP-dependent RNA helicase a-like protein [Plakobranchus ocellatus]
MPVPAVTFLCLGLYPNVCYHKEKRKVLTQEAKAALVHKSSVNCSNFPVEFPSPFFIFGEKIRTRAVSCKQMTNVSPVQLLLFGSRQVKGHGDNVVLDNWINLKMEASLAAKIVALRPPLEALVVWATKEPEQVSTPGPQEENLLGVIRALSRQNAGRHGMAHGRGGFSRGAPPPKMARMEGDFGQGFNFRSGFSGRGGGGRGGFYGRDIRGGRFGGRGGGRNSFGGERSRFGGRGGGFGGRGGSDGWSGDGSWH